MSQVNQSAIRSLEARLRDLWEKHNSCDPSELEATRNLLRIYTTSLIRLLEQEFDRIQVDLSTADLFDSVVSQMKALFKDMRNLDHPNGESWTGMIKDLEVDYSKRMKYEWKPIEPSAELTTGDLFFVNRENAVSELVKLLSINNTKIGGTNPGEGQTFHVGIIDHLFGMGKTTFGCNFIHECSKLLSRIEAARNCGALDPIVAKYDNDVLSVLSRSRTLNVLLEHSSLLQAMLKPESEKRSACESILIKRILESLAAYSGVNPQCVHSIGKGISDGDINTSASLLRRLIVITGGDPVFIVLDEMGTAFAGELDVIERRRHFNEFCQLILLDWLRSKDLHFIIVGRGSVFEWNGNRPESGSIKSVELSSYHFVRLPLGMIREKHVLEIMKFTERMCEVKRGDQIVTEYPYLVDFYSLTQEELCSVVSGIVKQTNGHPRSILEMLTSCETKEDLLNFKPPLSDIEEWGASLLPYSESLKQLLHSQQEGVPFNLSHPLNQRQTKSLTFCQLADRAFLRWEGDLTRATLHATPEVRAVLVALCFSCKAYMTNFVPGADLVLHRDRILEIALIKRFQDMFGTKCSPGQLYPNWFGETDFGRLTGFSVTGKLSGFPKNTRRSGQSTPVNPESRTAHPATWPFLLQSTTASVPACYLPLPNSMSSDGLIMTYGHLGGKRLLVTLGIAAKCQKATICDAAIKEEIRLFNRMFEDTSAYGEKRKSKDEELRLLFICFTGGYTRKHEFVGNRNHTTFPIDHTIYPYVHHVMLLNLGTEKRRAEFFDVLNDPTFKANLENVVNGN